MDNLSLHKGKQLRSVYEEENIHAIYNVPFEPANMPIEGIFSIVKRHYRNERLHHLVNGKEVDERALIRRAFNQVKPDNIRNAIKASMKFIGVMVK